MIISSPTLGLPARVASDQFFFMSPYRSLYTSGCFSRLTLPATAGDDLQGSFQHALAQAFANAKAQGIDNPIMVGAIPFDTQQPSALFIPQTWHRFSYQEKQQTAHQCDANQTMTVKQCCEIPDRQGFQQIVANAAALTATPQVDKIVLSRLLDITTDKPVDTNLLLERLIVQNPTSFNFHVPLADGSTLLGASPELLLRKEGEKFSSLPLAGSARRQANEAQDKAVGAMLLASSKDRHEHALVTRAMQQVLQTRSRAVDVPDIPQLITTSTLWHLATPISGVANPQENALSLACLLHPTPALSGYPHHVSKQLIAELEPFDRKLFGGIVGWCDAQGNGEWVVTIRCALIDQQNVRLFAGAGIVPASSPESEWRETGVKLSTMLNVFGITSAEVQ